VAKFAATKNKAATINFFISENVIFTLPANIMPLI